LLVDDDEDVLDALGTLLESHGVTVTRASSAFAALKILQDDPAPCLVLLDIRMPGMSGWDLWAWMQREPLTAAIPVVMISGEGQGRDDARARGVVDLLVKPVDAREVIAMVSRYCRGDHSR
jgi:CheY-like chemotaxis protein